MPHWQINKVDLKGALFQQYITQVYNEESCGPSIITKHQQVKVRAHICLIAD